MRWYQKCQVVLEEELGVSPLEPTKQMYEMIIESENYTNQITALIGCFFVWLHLKGAD